MDTKDTYLNKPEISVKQNSCTGCGLCVKVCPVRIYKIIDKKAAVARDRNECCLCGQCLAVCQKKSIVHSGFDLSLFRRISSNPVYTETVYNLLSQRRSIRNYRENVPPRELIEKIIEIAGYSPGSPHHRVGWVRNFSVVYGHDNMKQVQDMTAEYLKKLHKLVKNPLVRMAAYLDDSIEASFAVLPDIEMRLQEYKEGRDAIVYNAPVAVFAYAPENSSMPHSDCDAAISYIQLYAYSLGIGTCWNGLIQMAAAGEHLRNYKKLSRFLKIPEGHKCYAAITAGYPSVKLHSIPKRDVDIKWI